MRTSLHSTVRTSLHSTVNRRNPLGLRPGCSWTKANTPSDITCEIEGEALHRYKPGGYHPVHLGDDFDNGRYSVLHKLGWGGFATIWLAFDRNLNRNVAVKINFAELGQESTEIQIYRRLYARSEQHRGAHHVPKLLNSFTLEGPNGKHSCLVTDLLGPSVATASERYSSGRLPGRIAWQAVRQVTEALAHLHSVGTVHGDMHTGNIMFSCDERLKQPQTQPEWIAGTPEKGDIHALHYGASIPEYMVEPLRLPLPSNASTTHDFKLIDFGTSFMSGINAPEIGCPLPFRAPEAVLTKDWDTPADIWSLGCTIFSLVVGYPPFESMFSSERDLVAEWSASLGPLPQEWDGQVMSLQEIQPAEVDVTDLSEWLRETYYDEDKKPFFAEQDLEAIGDLILSTLKYQPSERPIAQDLLEHPLLRNDPFKDR